MAEICEYLEVFYNRQRRHASLGNIFPSPFERKYWTALKTLGTS
jgi:transposase InsO family protein